MEETNKFNPDKLWRNWRVVKNGVLYKDHLVIPFQWSARLKCIYRFYILAPKLKCMVRINNILVSRQYIHTYLYLIYYYYILNFLIQIYLGAEFLSQGLKWTRASTIEKRLYVGLDSHWRNLWFIIQRVVMSCAEVNFRVWAACIKRFVSQ